MTKCIMREIENLQSNQQPWIKETLQACKNIVKLPCKHEGGILPPDECIRNYVGCRNESKVFVATQDEELRNYLRNNVGTVPIFFMRNSILILDSPSEVT